MGHSSSRAALIYQHMTSDRDRAADRLGAMIRDGDLPDNGDKGYART
ncbi:integrase [Streptomyces mirabilis]|nr:integrase [Streptomyces sp. GbtcB7]